MKGPLIDSNRRGRYIGVVMTRIYLDHTATTPIDPRVLESMQPCLGGLFGNASSVHSFGREAKSALERARSVIAAAVGAEPGEIFFTSGGTESDNLAIMGAARAGRNHGKNRVVATRAEHHAVIDPCDHLLREGYDVRLLAVDGNGALRPSDAADSLAGTTAIISVMHANNEVGTISDIRAIASLARERGVPCHTDAVQTLGKTPVNVRDLGVDLMSLSAHKLYGPKGIGALYIRRGIEVESLLYGGGQERGRRPGTENVALAVGFARAVELALEMMDGESARLRRLRDDLEDRIVSAFPQVIVNGDRHNRLPHVLSISFDSGRLPLEGEMLVMNMDLAGIAVSSGSACTSGSVQPSHVMLAMGRDPDTARATLRFSFGMSNSEEDLDRVVVSLTEAVRMAQKSRRG